MPVWRIFVEWADGDDFSRPRFWSEVEVEADTPREARMIAEQMVWTPMRGKPSHTQIVATEIVSVVE